VKSVDEVKNERGCNDHNNENELVIHVASTNSLELRPR
jgi:hypothetical protein